jgi:pyridoxine 5'-phosphate synthase PdxJ
VGAVDRNVEEEREDLQEETGDNVNENDQEMEDQTEDLKTNGRVELYGDEGDRKSDSSLSMTTKIKNVEEGKSPNYGKKKNKEVGILEEIEEANGNRFSNNFFSSFRFI